MKVKFSIGLSIVATTMFLLQTMPAGAQQVKRASLVSPLTSHRSKRLTFVPTGDEARAKQVEFNKAYVSGRYVDAVTLFEQYVKMSPFPDGFPDSFPFAMYAFCLYKTGHRDEAVTQFEKAILKQKQDWERNNKDREFIPAENGDDELYLRYAQVLADMGRTEQAREFFMLGTTIYQKNIASIQNNRPWTEPGFDTRFYSLEALKALIRMGAVRIHQGDSTFAIMSMQDCDEAMKLKPDMALVQYYNAQTLRTLNWNDKATGSESMIAPSVKAQVEAGFKRAVELGRGDVRRQAQMQLDDVSSGSKQAGTGVK